MICPRCQVDMRQANRMDVEIDFCPRCRGVWLDGGELEKIVERSQDIMPQDYAPSSQDYQPSAAYGARPRQKPQKKKSFLGELFDLFD